MPKYLLAVARPSHDGWERCEVGNFLVHIASVTLSDPDIVPFVQDVLHFPAVRFPTHVCRNLIVKTAQEKKVDFLWMIDADAAPDPLFFQASFWHLVKNDPCVIGAPYVSADGIPQVLMHTTTQARHPGSQNPYPLETWKTLQIPRESYPFFKGIQKVASIGTHLCAYNMRVFDQIKPPYFDYAYNDDHTAITGTEDIVAHNALYYSGCPIYCDFDHPAGHWKEVRVDVPVPLPDGIIPKFFTEAAESKIRHERSGLETKELIPKKLEFVNGKLKNNIEGYEDYPCVQCKQKKIVRSGMVLVCDNCRYRGEFYSGQDYFKLDPVLFREWMKSSEVIPV